AVLRAAIAIERFRLENGRSPETMAELSKTPTDPLTDLPLEYEVDGESFVIRAPDDYNAFTFRFPPQ
ncbi:MAG: hypothetical protein ACKVHP_02125, partial [Verrucomicrobiales bacterium]